MWRLIVLGLLAFLAFVIATLPATMITDRLGATGIVMNGVQGSIWNGEVAQAQAGSVNLGQLHWKLHPLALFTGKLSADFDLRGATHSLNGKVAAGMSGDTSFENVRGTAPLELLPRNALPGGWTGQLSADLARLKVIKGWPVEASGTLKIANLTGPAQQPKNLGDFRVTLPAATGNSTPGLTGKLESISGPLNVSGVLKFNADHTYLIEGEVAAQPNAPSDIAEGLKQYLGIPEANGKYLFSVAGTM